MPIEMRVTIARQRPRRIGAGNLSCNSQAAEAGRRESVHRSESFGQRADSAGRNAAVDEQSLAGYVATGFCCEKDDGRIEIVGWARSLQRDAVIEIFDPFFIFIENLVLLGAQPSGRQTIYG